MIYFLNIKMKQIREFPMSIICSYKGESNLDETLDDHITCLIGKYFCENKIEYKILDLNCVKPRPNINDELIQYKVEMNVNLIDVKIDSIQKELENFKRG